MRLILASASPRRAELLGAAGYTFEVRAADIDERTRPGESPAQYVLRLAQDKSAAALRTLASNPAEAGSHRTDVGSRFSGIGNPAEAGSHRADVGSRFSGIGNPAEAGSHRADVGSRFSGIDLIILAADTTVVVDDHILGKPVDDEDARRMLRLLSGRGHQVLTGVSLRTPTVEASAVEMTEVWFHELTVDELDWYIGGGEGRDKAGAYAIQGLAARFIPRIDGSYSNVVGLPIATVHMLLSKLRRLRRSELTRD